MLERIKGESVWLCCPGFADELVGGEAFEGLEPPGEVVGGDKVCQVAAELVVGFVVEAPDGGLFDRPVHPLDLAVGPRMLRLGQAMVDVGKGASVLEGVRSERLFAFDHVADLGRAPGGAAGIGEVGAVVGEHGVDFVGHCLDEGPQEVGGGARGGFYMQFGEGELGGPVDRDEQVEPAFGGLDLGDVDMEIANWIALELPLARRVALDIGQPGDAVALQTAMQRGSRQVRDRRLQRVETVIERQQRVPTERDDDASSSIDSTVDLAVFGPVGRSASEERCRHLATVFGLIP